jgi:hypothetical protein
MGGPLNLEAPTALDYFATLVAEDEGFPLVEAAVSVAQDEQNSLDPQGVLATIDALADKLRRRIPADAAPLQRLRLVFGKIGQNQVRARSLDRQQRIRLGITDDKPPAFLLFIREGR